MRRIRQSQKLQHVRYDVRGPILVEAQRLEAAVGRVYRDGKVLTPDQGGSARTRDMAQAVLAAYR